MNSQHENTNSKGDFIFKNWVETFVLKISDIKGVKNISEQSVIYLVQL